MRTAHGLGLLVVALGMATLTPRAVAQQCVIDAQINEALPPPTQDRYPWVVDGGGGNLANALVELMALSPPTNPLVGRQVVVVGPGIYTAITVEPDLFPDGLVIYAADPTMDTIIDGGVIAPAVTLLAGGGAGTGIFRLGWVGSLDPNTWRGFILRNGYSFDYSGGGGGVSARAVQSPIELYGNEITANFAVQAGGGVYLEDCSALLAFNNIHQNQATDRNYIDIPIRGAGVYQVRGDMVLVANTIHENSFGRASPPLNVEVSREGGGVASFMDSSPEPIPSPKSFTACANEIYLNDASDGGGIWIEQLAHHTTITAEVTSNHIHDNVSWRFDAVPSSSTFDMGFRGGGLWIHGASQGDAGGKGGLEAGSVIANVYSNKIQHNQAVNVDELPVTVSDDEAGGGIYVSYVLRVASDRIALESNAAWDNEAGRYGGGLYFDVDDINFFVALDGILWHETQAFNRVPATGLGAGLYLTAGTPFNGSSNVTFHNDSVGATPDSDWYAEIGVTDVMRYSQMPTYVAVYGGANLFSALDQCDDAEPFTLASGDPHLRIDPVVSPCIDTAEPGLPVDTPVDIDLHARAIPFPAPPAPLDRDRGADEFVSFRRGDANADGCVNIADVVFMLDALFTPSAPQPQCPVATDVNDDGSRDIADPIYLLGYLFSGGAQPPPPFPDCGPEDPTPDALGIGIGTPCPDC